MTPLAAALLTTLAVLQEPAPSRPAIEKKQVSAFGLTVHFLTIPWGPNTIAAMEEGGESFYASRTWPFARMQTTVPMALDGTTVPPGNYALVFHPNTPDKKGMSLEVRGIAVEEFLVPGSVMTRTPDGDAVARTPAVFETVAEGAITLDVGLRPRDGGTSLVIRYGDRRLVKELLRVRAP
jgi:hypothetical protein